MLLMWYFIFYLVGVVVTFFYVAFKDVKNGDWGDEQHGMGLSGSTIIAFLWPFASFFYFGGMFFTWLGERIVEGIPKLYDRLTNWPPKRTVSSVLEELKDTSDILRDNVKKKEPSDFPEFDD